MPEQPGLSDLYVEGDKHQVSLYLVNGMEVTQLIDFNDGSGAPQPTGEQARGMIYANITNFRLREDSPHLRAMQSAQRDNIVRKLPQHGVAQDGTLFFWRDVVAAQYVRVVRAAPRLIVPGVAG